MGLQDVPHRAQHPARDGEWLEVAHSYLSNMPEGASNFGCWAFPMRGTGVWLNVGRTSAGRDRAHMSKALLRSLHLSEASARNVDMRYYDGIFGPLAGIQGYDSLQFLRMRAPPSHSNELVHFGPGCMSGIEPLPCGCLPDAIVRGGWDHSLPCLCKPARAANCISASAWSSFAASQPTIFEKCNNSRFARPLGTTRVELIPHNRRLRRI